MAQSDKPAGFEEFWREAFREADAAPLEFTRTETYAYSTTDHAVETIAFRSINGQELHGWAALPRTTRQSPGFLWVPPYSRWSMLPNQYGTRPGFASFSLNFFGESSFHQEAYTPARGYFAEGIEAKETWVFRRMVQDAQIALRVFSSFDEVDSGRLSACGMSQGAGLSIWLGAWSGLVKCVCADMPFLGGIQELFTKERAFRYPLKELDDWIGGDPARRAHLLDVLPWFDTVNHASCCTVPTLLTLGHKDPAVKPWQVQKVYEALAGEKQLVELDWGHDWHQSMVERNQDWMEKWLF